MRRVAMLGAGSWGTALAIHMARSGHEVRLWARDPATVRDIRDRRANVVYLPDIMLPAAVSPTDSLEDAVAGSELVVCAIPSHGCRAVVRAAAPHLAPQAVLVSATKGLVAPGAHCASEIPYFWMARSPSRNVPSAVSCRRWLSSILPAMRDSSVMVRMPTTASNSISISMIMATNKAAPRCEALGCLRKDDLRALMASGFSG